LRLRLESKNRIDARASSPLAGYQNSSALRIERAHLDDILCPMLLRRRPAIVAVTEVITVWAD